MQGFIYPNEFELHWGLLVVLYPYLTGLVAGAFILASLERVFNVKEVQPTYRLALLTALAFLLVAPLPLLAHLGHPLRSYEIFLTPNRQSAMAMFGFVYAWYLMVVLLLEIWFDYRQDLVLWYQSEKGWRRWVHYALTLGATDLSPKALRFDEQMGRWITIIGIPSAFLLHGYVGFIFGSVKANPWWSSVLMPVVFLFSAIVSGIALVLIIYMISSMLRWKPVDMRCADKLAAFLFYAMVVDVSLEALDFIHRLYESEESIGILSQMIENRLFISLIVLQVVLGTLLPLAVLMLTAPALTKESIVKIPDELKRLFYLGAAILVQIGIFSIRWNVVIGGQLFSKSLRGLTVYKLELFGLEGLLVAIGLLILPFIILWVLVKILPPWTDAQRGTGRSAYGSGAVAQAGLPQTGDSTA
jgi:Ni/Fe-hydrogenase subunit HybB-like protein